jgi:predicted RNA binding protein YcfA (HicA-like mRNA interferase family)
MKGAGEVSWRKFERFILSRGCQFKKTTGDHNKYKKTGLARPIIIPRYKALPDFIITNNLKLLGISKEEFLEEIKKY